MKKESLLMPIIMLLIAIALMCISIALIDDQRKPALKTEGVFMIDQHKNLGKHLMPQDEKEH